MKYLLVLSAVVLILAHGCTSETNSESQVVEACYVNQTNKQVSQYNIPPTAFVDAPKIVDQLPYFDGARSKKESDNALIEYLYKNLKYPEAARDARVEGRVYIQFIVEEDGSVSNIHLARGVGGGCDEAALAVVEGINDLDIGWSTPIHQGKASKVMYTLPITFKLEG